THGRVAAVVRYPRLSGGLYRATVRAHGGCPRRAALGAAWEGGTKVTSRTRALGGLAGGLSLAPPALPPGFLQLLTEIAIVGLFATAFNLLMGFGGMVSFGHAAYFALGAYAAALLVKRAGVPMLLALPAAPVVAAGGALLFGFFIVRLTHTYFA